MRFKVGAVKGLKGLEFRQSTTGIRGPDLQLPLERSPIDSLDTLLASAVTTCSSRVSLRTTRLRRTSVCDFNAAVHKDPLCVFAPRPPRTGG